jgi:hypothetical protein
MSNDDEKKTILGYVSDYLNRPLRSLSEVEGKAALDPPASARTASQSYLYERRATTKRGTPLHKICRRKEDSIQ